MYVAVHVFYNVANKQTLVTIMTGFVRLLAWGFRPTQELFTHCNLTKASVHPIA